MSDRSELEQAIRETGGTIVNGKVRGGNLGKVARKLGVARRTIYNRMREYGLAGTRGRPKRSYSKRTKRYAAVAAAVVLVGGAALYSSKRSTPT
jgi:transposase-like protein